MRQVGKLGQYIISLRTSAGLSQIELARCVGSSRSAISRLELGDTPQPFKGNARQLVLGIAGLLTTTTQETYRYLELAKIDTALLAESEQAMLGILPATPADPDLITARIHIYQALLTQLEERERAFGNVHAPQVLKAQIQQCATTLQALQSRAGHRRATMTDITQAAADVRYAEMAAGRIIVGGQRGMESTNFNQIGNLFALASERALWLMDLTDGEYFAIDDCISIARSREFRGWAPGDIQTTLLTAPMPIPHDLDELRQRKVKTIERDYTNGLHYRLVSFTPTFGSVERDHLQVTLAPLHFFDYYAISPFFDEPVLQDAIGAPVTIRQKYGSSALSYMSAERGTALIPAPISLQCVVVTADQQILLMRRSDLVAFYPRHWSASFEETMNGNPGPPGTINRVEQAADRDFVAGAIRGLEEEFAIMPDQVETVSVLSLNVEYLTLSVDVILVISLKLTSETIRQRWLLRASDTSEANKFGVVPARLDTVIAKLYDPSMLWHPTSRMRLIQFLFNRFGIQATTQAVEQYTP